MDEVADKVNDVKTEYSNKENEIKQKKAKLSELRSTFEAVKAEYEEASSFRADIKVSALRLRTEQFKGY